MRYIHAELLVREIMTLGHLILNKTGFWPFSIFLTLFIGPIVGC